MTNELTEVTVEILGKPYQIKCPPTETAALRQAARYFEEKMRHLHDGSVIMNVEKIAIIAGLNVAHQLLDYENQKERDLQGIKQRLLGLQNKIEEALIFSSAVELQPVE